MESASPVIADARQQLPSLVEFEGGKCSAVCQVMEGIQKGVGLRLLALQLRQRLRALARRSGADGNPIC